MKSDKRRNLLSAALLAATMAWTPAAVGQTPAAADGTARPLSANDSPESLRELRQQVKDLQRAVAAMRAEWKQSREETEELRAELQAVRSNAPPEPRLAGAALNARSVATQQGDEPAQGQGATLEEEYQLLSGKVDDQYQTKVESASKYRVRLSGIALLNVVSNQGVVDSVDIPSIAYPRGTGYTDGSFSATLRQSEIGLEVFGPSVMGARSRGAVQIDFAGGFPAVPNGVGSGLMRLRTGTIRLDWKNTSVVAGQDALFFSPNSPTSYASLAVPALSSAGNLWSWVPQIQVERRFALADDSTISLQGGILDPLTGEVPSAGSYRQPGPGEAARQPAYASRVGWSRMLFGRPLRLGMGGFYGRQNYGFDRRVDSWAGTADLEVPLSQRISLSGSFYRGRALGGFYGGIGRSVLFSGDPTNSYSEVLGLNSIGGWAQVKFRPVSKWEFNTAFGLDNPYAADLKYYANAQSYGNPVLARNREGFANVIYHPRSDLLFAAEYRRISTYSLKDGLDSAGHLNLSVGVLF